MKDGKSLHCGVRKVFHPVYATEQSKAPSGVEAFECLSELDVDDVVCYKESDSTEDFWQNNGSHDPDDAGKKNQFDPPNICPITCLIA